MSGSNVNTIAQLNSAIEAADALVANSGTYTITLTSDVTLGGNGPRSGQSTERRHAGHRRHQWQQQLRLDRRWCGST